MQLVELSGGRGQLDAPAAASLKRVDAEIGHEHQITEAWRSIEKQRQYWDAYQAYLNGGPYAPIAAKPGSDAARHPLGLAIDTDERDTDILNDHGFYHTVYRSGVLVEPWHYEYFSDRDNHLNDKNGALGMLSVRNQSTGEVALYEPGFTVVSEAQYKTARNVQNIQATRFPAIVPRLPALTVDAQLNVSQSDWNNLKAIYG